VTKEEIHMMNQTDERLHETVCRMSNSKKSSKRKNMFTILSMQ